MTENPADASEASSDDTPDLSGLANLNFGPSWLEKGNQQPKNKTSKSGQKHRNRKQNSDDHNKRDRRGSFKKSAKGSNEQGQFRSREYSKYDREHTNLRNSKHNFFKPTVTVNIYPQDEAFDALVKRLRSSVRTYQLFEIAHLILEKPERYQIVVQNKATKDETPKPLYRTLSESLPFETEEDAINHFINNNLETLFDVETTEVEPPKGNFQVVNQCTVTGELLGPPNYHLYQSFLQRHYSTRISNMSFEQFVSKVKAVKEQESIDAWLESMKKGARYTLKERKEDEPESFESLEAVRLFIAQNRKDEIVASGETVRFAGRSIDQLPKGAIRQSIEGYIGQQKHFPLDTANNIRGRLRRHKFAVYKKGSKGISYVCAVRRKFRDDTTVFTSSIQELIEFIEKNPEIPAFKLPKQYIGIDTEKQKSAKLEMVESEADAKQAEAASNDEQSADETDGEAGKAVETPQATEAEESPHKDAASSVAAPKEVLDEADQKRLNQLMLDLRWLITEGYVTEYGDGRLFAAPPVETKAKEKEIAKSGIAEDVDADSESNATEEEDAIQSKEV